MRWSGTAVVLGATPLAGVLSAAVTDRPPTRTDLSTAGSSGLTLGAGAGVPDETGTTALAHARRRGFAAIERILRGAGARR